MCNWDENVKFPKHFKPLPPGYRIVQLDSGHYMWLWGTQEEIANNDYSEEGMISWDRYWVRRCAFANYEERT
jgi:hypothetical protein